MAKRYIQSQADLEKHLDGTVDLMEASARSFDAGRVGEAARLALAIRVLVHDTQKSKSLLGQLGKKRMPFYDTAADVPPGRLGSHNGIVLMLMAGGEGKYVAPLDMLPPDRTGKNVDFDTWWSKVIFVDNRGREMTRQSLILNIADTDGGAHVDPTLDETYAALTRENSLAWVSVSPKGELPLEEPHLAAVRQITHEVLKSLNPSMPTVEPTVPSGATLAVVSITGTPTSRSSSVVSLTLR